MANAAASGTQSLSDVTERTQVGLDKATITQPLQECPESYATTSFIAVFTKARHCPLLRATRIKPTRHILYLETQF
jgi:hypothetical protein